MSWRSIICLGVVCALPGSFSSAAERDEANLSARLKEVRGSFTLDGKPIPPEIFRDFGDGNLADSGSIWVTVDLAYRTCATVLEMATL